MKKSKKPIPAVMPAAPPDRFWKVRRHLDDYGYVYHVKLKRRGRLIAVAWRTSSDNPQSVVEAANKILGDLTKKASPRLDGVYRGGETL